MSFTYSRLGNNRKSYNAFKAEENSRYSLLQAASKVAEYYNCSVAHAKAFLLFTGTSEWHHTGKFAKQTLYYNVSSENLDELKEDFANFKYAPAKKTSKKEMLFKCWNIDSDIRKWEWKITNRDGSNTMSLTEAAFLAKKELDQNWPKRLTENNQNKTQRRIAREKISESIKILKVIKEFANV